MSTLLIFIENNKTPAFYRIYKSCIYVHIQYKYNIIIIILNHKYNFTSNIYYIIYIHVILY